MLERVACKGKNCMCVTYGLVFTAEVEDGDVVADGVGGGVQAEVVVTEGALRGLH